MELCKKIVEYCAKQGCPLDSTEGYMNLVYVEGIDADGKANENRPDIFNDRRLVITPSADELCGFKIVLNSAATTEPGQYYTNRPLSRQGAARIGFGKHTAWRMGLHKGTQPALIQVLPVLVYRDLNQDGKRNGDNYSKLLIGLNHHTTSIGYSGTSIGRFSAGCCVGYNYFEHLYFLYLMSKDPRYVADKNFIFSATVIPGNELPGD